VLTTGASNVITACIVAGLVRLVLIGAAGVNEIADIPGPLVANKSVSPLVTTVPLLPARSLAEYTALAMPVGIDCVIINDP